MTSLNNNINLLKYITPEKYINFFKKYPRLQNLLKFKNKILRNYLINFYFRLVKKNKKLKFFFLDESKEINQINFKSKDLFENNKHILESLAYNGIVILEEAINSNEREKILRYFDEIENKNISSEWINNEIINASIVKYKNNNDLEIFCMKKNLNYLPKLSKLIDCVTKEVFGNKVDTIAEFFFHKCKNIENPDLQEDTKFHLDRYLPCLKIIYSPNSIDHSDAPFGYIKRTHKLNNNFMKNFMLNSKKFFVNENELNENLKKNALSLTCPANSLIITFTNGLHKRNIFKKKNSRRTIFFQFTDNFKFFSLLNHKKYN